MSNMATKDQLKKEVDLAFEVFEKIAGNDMGSWYRISNIVNHLWDAKRDAEYRDKFPLSGTAVGYSERKEAL